MKNPQKKKHNNIRRGGEVMRCLSPAVKKSAQQTHGANATASSPREVNTSPSWTIATVVLWFVSALGDFEYAMSIVS